MTAPGAHDIDRERASAQDGLKVMLVHDASDPEVARALSRDGHDVLAVPVDESPARLLDVFGPEVIVITALDTVATCRNLRGAAPGVAIVAIVVGQDVIDRVCALEAGADDCLGSPFRAAELIARVRAARRRALRQAGGASLAVPVRRAEVGR